MVSSCQKHPQAQLQRRIRSSNQIGRCPCNTWARCLSTVPREAPDAPHFGQDSDALVKRHSIDSMLYTKVLPGCYEAELIELAKAGKVRGRKGKIRHVGAWSLLV